MALMYQGLYTARPGLSCGRGCEGVITGLLLVVVLRVVVLRAVWIVAAGGVASSCG